MRQSTVTDELAEVIFQRLAEGESLRAICRDEGMPSVGSVLLRCSKDAPFAEQYARARALGLEVLADEIVAIADTTEMGETITSKEWGEERKTGDMTEHRRMRIESRKWILSKLLPKKYGEKLELAGDSENPLQVVVRRLTNTKE